MLTPGALERPVTARDVGAGELARVRLHVWRARGGRRLAALWPIRERAASWPAGR